MPVTSKDAFDSAIERAEHFLRLYDLLHDSRQRGVRKDWRQRFNQGMHWPQDEQIVRIDGKDKDSLLILRESVGIDRKKFKEEYTPELLRASITSAVAALDRYIHDLIVERCWALLGKREDQIPKELKKLKVPVVSIKKALEKLRSDPKARPGTLMKKEIQKILHREITFQNVSLLSG